MHRDAVVECVPNFSEGRDTKKIEAIAGAIRAVNNVKLLDVDPGADTNRTVYTFVGSPDAVVDAALAAARAAWEQIDMASHRGAHPRIGALDVCPFIPVSGITMDECAELARDFGKRLAEELNVPVYLYEKSASRPERTSLADIRTGEYEGLSSKLQDPAWQPDFGPARFVPRWGATVAGAREFLIAYNVNLNTKDKKLANEIALTIREGGRSAKNPDGSIARDAQGNAIKVPGRLKAVRAIGWYIDEYRCAQVSINLLDYHLTPLYEVFEVVKEEAEKLGLLVTGSELVGLVPLAAIEECGRHFAVKAGKSAGLPEKELVEIAIQSLGLRSVSAFEPEHKIIEWNFRKPAPLASSRILDFLDELSTDSPAPGGGSAAALAGSLGAALAAMVGNLTVGKKGYEAGFDELGAMAQKAQHVKAKLAAGIDRDTEAFNAILEAGRMPKATEEQKKAREQAMEKASREAVLVPLENAKTCLEALVCTLTAAKLGNRNSVTDAGTGALLAKAGLESALLNVEINIKSMTDSQFTGQIAAETRTLREQSGQILAEVLTQVEKCLSGAEK